MPKHVDREEKKLAIAQASVELFCQKGLRQVSIEEIAKASNIGKGTVYLYFKNKEEIIFYVWDMFAEAHCQKFMSECHEKMNIKEKIMRYFEYPEFAQEGDRMLVLFQQFLGAVLVDDTGILAEYSGRFFQKDFDFVMGALKQSVEKNEICTLDFDSLATTIILMIKGMVCLAKARNLSFSKATVLLRKQLIFLLDSFIKEIK
ncbi:MAG: TetR/AcrR family transcriptional regulator [Sulfurospirillaceae bacterium]|nr:TetR/AcrR family transcriptional regulator [Sulfurospirillaceae bacterium]